MPARGAAADAPRGLVASDPPAGDTLPAPQPPVTGSPPPNLPRAQGRGRQRKITEINPTKAECG